MTGPLPLEEGRAMVISRAMGLCEVQAEGCRMQPVEHHHRQKRGLGDHRPSNGVAACRPCHTDTHAHPERAIMRGLIVPTWATPVTTPALLHPRGEPRAVLVHLSHGGTYL